MEPIKILIHAPTVDGLERGVNNLRNLLREEPDAQIELVVNGPAARAAMKLEEQAVRDRLVLCQNSLIRLDLKPEFAVRTVKAAIQHLAHRQREGWCYVRA